MGSKVEINEQQVFELASRFWTNTEIAAFFGCCDKTIRNRFSDIVAKGRECGKGKLRDAQFNSAVKKGNVTMQIWLGKQYLEQREHIEVSNNDLIEEELEFVGMPKRGSNGNGRFKRFYG